MAAVGAAASIPLVGAAAMKPTAKLTPVSNVNSNLSLSNQPLVAHIANPASGEIRIMFGTHEVIHNDPELVAKLIRVTL